MPPKNLCQHTNECPIYKGEKDSNGTPLAIYKNVFCNRGSKGWYNCEQFLQYNNEAPEEKNEQDN